MIAPPEEVVRAAARTLLREERLDTSTLAAELGISRVTLFRRVGNRDAILGEALWALAERTLRTAAEAYDARPAGAETSGRLRCLAVTEDFRHTVSESAALRRLVAEEPTSTLRIATDPRGRVQPRLVEAYTELFQRDVDEHGLTPQVPLPLLAFGVVRLGESFLYSDVMVSRAPDLKAATTVLDALVTGVIGLPPS
ncbi:QsdR family transcriptional regulator [Modestobacter versicolor]|uniref:Transcriptional regulator n=1 Tax=Modestobacter versicolor TaxID=429133 RepID=A0A323VCQ2_9ACTN|nr:QsdR family transcriptional regulator [Modestobacter versicolor]MBB3676101.1 AcrR family transcriptional regulator [Modestobacter versicolor]PZA22682.1 transcriptional regulator [Modestobacter versicolor]